MIRLLTALAVVAMNLGLPSGALAQVSRNNFSATVIVDGRQFLQAKYQSDDRQVTVQMDPG